MGKQKFNSRRVFYNEIWFDSERELWRWRELCLWQNSGEITDLKAHTTFILAPGVVLNGRKKPPLRYTDDADYIMVTTGELVVEDVKAITKIGKTPTVTEGYRIRKHLMKLKHDIEITEIYLLKIPNGYIQVEK